MYFFIAYLNVASECLQNKKNWEEINSSIKLRFICTSYESNFKEKNSDFINVK